MRIIIVGAGVTGLAAAHRLQELRSSGGLDIEFDILDAAPRAGGIVATERHEGCLVEGGPDSMITDKPWGAALAERLDLADELIATESRNRRSFVVHQGELHPIPEGFQVLAPGRLEPLLRSPLFSPAGKARMAMERFIPPRAGPGDESVGSFVTRRLGREALDRLAQPLVAGIYGADPWNLSLQATLPRFLEMERQHGSLARGMRARAAAAAPAAPVTAVRDEDAPRALPAGGPGDRSGVSGARYGLFVSFRSGMQIITDRLQARLPPEALRLQTRVARAQQTGDGWKVILSDGRVEEAAGLLLALPTWVAARILRQQSPVLAAQLDSIPYASAATLTFCYPAERVGHPLDGFGFVVPAREGRTLLGCTFSHRKFAGRAPAGFALLRAFVGEAVLQGRSPVDLERLVQLDLADLLGITGPPLWIRSWMHEAAMPSYTVGHLERLAALEQDAASLRGLALAGNGYRGVGIPDSIHSGEEAAERLAALA